MIDNSVTEMELDGCLGLSAWIVLIAQDALNHLLMTN